MSAIEVSAAGHDRFRAGKVLVVPGLPNRLGTLVVRFLARARVRKITAGFQA
jgi:hypothetical protein